MFGNKPAFGAAAPNNSFGFGSPSTSTANPFGSNQLFGKPNTGGFGSPSSSTFGQPAGNSLFPNTQQQPTNLFQNANTAFGTPASSSSGFGSNLFGQQQPTTSGLFGSTSAFNQQNKPSTFGFGSNQTQPSLFGQQPQPAQGSSMFNSTPSNLFGGASAFGGQQQSGTVLKFNPVTGNDTMMKNGVAQSISTKHHCITCMKEYENKSLEELRWEDYQANRKGQQQTGFASTPFGATASTAPSLFGQPESKPVFGGQSTGPFGQTTSTFGQTTPAFGLGTQTNTGGLFGKPTTFGAPTSSTSSYGFGGAPQNANPFGANQAAKPFGSAAQPLFGSSTAQPTQSTFGTGLFGQTNNQTTGSTLFGKPAQPTTGFTTGQTPFGQPAATTQTSSLFTNKPTLFGQTPSSGTTGFGTSMGFGQNTTQSSFNLGFGKTTTPAFGQGTTPAFGSTLGVQPQGSSLFGNTANKPGGLFGVQQTTGLFGNTNTPYQQNTSFGLQTQQPQQSLFPPPEQQAATNLALLTSDPFGDAPHLAGLEPKLRSEMAPAITATNPNELKSLLDSSKKVDVSHSTRLKVIPLKSKRDSLFDGIHKSEPDTPSPIKTSCRRLVLKNKPTESPKLLQNEAKKMVGETPDKEVTLLAAMSGEINVDFMQSAVPVQQATPVRLNFETSLNEDDSRTMPSPIQGGSGQNSSLKLNLTSNSKNVSPPPSDDEAHVDLLASGDNPKTHPSGIICTRPEYYTLPNLEELTQYVDENGSCIVQGFTIGRKGYGNVHFPEAMDVAGFNIDELVHFRYREINVYPDDTKKPPVGQGLNRRAQVTLDNIYPRRSGTNTLIKDTSELLQMNFAEKLRKVTVKKGAKFVDYRPETGSWVFKVDHFSKYGFNDSDDENDQNGVKKKELAQKKKEAEKVPNKEELALIRKEQQKMYDDVNTMDHHSSKFGLDKDIFLEDEDQSVNGEDMLQHSMYVDMSEDDYPPHMASHLTSELPMHISYDPFKSSKTIQVMKSTLFGDDDRSSDGASSRVSIIRQYLDIQEDLPAQMAPIREEMVPRKRHIIRPRVAKVYNFGGSEVSTGVISNRCYMDLAIFKGKSFKLGWRGGFNFVNLNSKNGETNGQIGLTTIQPPSNGGVDTLDPLNDFLNDSLKIVLEQSTYELNGNIPTFRILKNECYLQKQTDLFEKMFTKYNTEESQYLYSIWTLCTALWGPSENTTDNRRYLFSEWLKANTNVGDDFVSSLSKLTPAERTTQKIFNMLTVFKVFDAADLAMNNRLPNLSLLISQLCVTNNTKLFLQEQIESWYNSMTANHFTKEMMKIYLLLSGIPSKEAVNIFENVDWKRAVGMHLWYVCSNSSSIEEAVELYKRAFEEIGYAEKPVPPYVTNCCSDESSCYDLLYHILLLYKNGIHRLSSVLNPATHTSDALDYRLSWLLLQLFLSLEVGLVEDCEINKFCTSFSNQLESKGLWEWSIYVLLFVKDDVLKKNLIMSILDRNLSNEVDEEAIEAENNLVNNMKIPPSWIHTVKAEKSFLEQRYLEAFNHFSHSQDWVKANEVLMEHILPNLFINEQYDIIKFLIKKIQPGSQFILKYNSEAGLLLDFINLQEDEEANNVRQLQHKLRSISERLCFFPVKTNQQKLCVAELSKRCSSLYIELHKQTKSNMFRASYIQFIDSLVMPPDFKQTEALHLINDFDNCLTMSS